MFRTITAVTAFVLLTAPAIAASPNSAAQQPVFEDGCAASIAEGPATYEQCVLAARVKDTGVWSGRIKDFKKMSLELQAQYLTALPLDEARGFKDNLLHSDWSAVRQQMKMDPTEARRERDLSK